MPPPPRRGDHREIPVDLIRWILKPWFPSRYRRTSETPIRVAVFCLVWNVSVCARVFPKRKKERKEGKEKKKKKWNEKRRQYRREWIVREKISISISIFNVWGEGEGRRRRLEKEAVIQVRRSVCESSGNLHLKELEDALGSYGVPGVPFRRLFLFSRNFLDGAERKTVLKGISTLYYHSAYLPSTLRPVLPEIPPPLLPLFAFLIAARSPRRPRSNNNKFGIKRSKEIF